MDWEIKKYEFLDEVFKSRNRSVSSRLGNYIEFPCALFDRWLLWGIGKARCEINESEQSVDRSGKEKKYRKKKVVFFEGIPGITGRKN